ncbi:reverse transcriptase domain-containing protein [Tanacetum coccineum]
MVPATTSLTGFSGETIWPLGQLRLLVTIGDAEHFTKAWMNFMIFPVDDGVVTIRSTILMPNECATITTTSKDSVKKIEGSQENLKVAIHHDFPDQEVALGGTLSIEGRTAVCALLKRNLDIFAWQPSDMTGVPRWTAEHRLNIWDGYPLVRQKKRGQAPKRAKAIQAEVQKLVKAGIMRDVNYHDWLSNPVMDCYPLPEIDWKVESLCGYPFKCLLDAYKGYHQIQMAEEDEEKTAFHTPHGVYCYTKMSFGLKNAGATYQRLVDKAFEKQVGRNLEVYVDDLVIKSHTEAELLRDIEETFRTLRKINIKLNPKKCTFGAVEGMFLGYMIGPKGINPCPEKIEAVLQLPSPRTVKEVQSLNGKLAGLNRTPHVGGTKAKGRANNVCIRLSRSGWRRLDEEKGLNPDASLFCSGLILTSPEGAEFTYALRFQFTASNNEAEYEALLAGLRIAAQIGVRNIRVSVDSKLVANQVLGTYIAKEENMIKYLEKVLVEVLQEKSIQEQEVAAVVEEEGPTWITPITEYLKDGVLPDDKKEASKLRIKARQYELDGRNLDRPLFMACLGCTRDMNYSKAEDCQVHRPVLRNPQQPLTPITSPWLFYKWGIDIAGPFLEGHGKVKFLIVAMDYFTKWIEAKAVATISGGQSNELVERANRSLGEGIKARLGEGNKNWIEEIPHVLWAHRTMIKSSNGDTPFSLSYGTEAVIPAEIGTPTYRTAGVDIVHNDDEIRLNLDLLDLLHQQP